MNFLAVGCGGFVGAMLRYGIDLLPFQSYTFPYKTLFINVIGSFVLGLVYAIAAQKQMPTVLLLFLGTGLCGGFTTYSTFAVQTAGLLQVDNIMAIVYVVLSLSLGVGAVYFATWLVRIA